MPLLLNLFEIIINCDLLNIMNRCKVILNTNIQLHFTHISLPVGISLLPPRKEKSVVVAVVVLQPCSLTQIQSPMYVAECS